MGHKSSASLGDSVQVYRSGTLLKNGDAYNPGETLKVSIHLLSASYVILFMDIFAYYRFLFPILGERGLL